MPGTLADSVSAFTASWFAGLDRHAPSEELENSLSTTTLEMVFPERTLRSIAEFRDWYTGVCLAYTAEEHTVEQVDITSADDDIEVTVVVLWRATRTSDDTRLAMRARQTWRLARAGTSFVITLYRVDDLTAI
ncbi:hypothetical protein [Actinoplanes palleronii]|nr:hypothetical protein [Actinoplanes palleronii]